MTLDRRGLLRGTVLTGGLAAAGLAGTGCSSTLATGFAGAQEPHDSLTFWNLFGGGDGVRMQQMERHYQRDHPGISLHAVTLTWGNPYYTKLALATLGDQPPQVAVSHLSRMPRLAAAKLLQPLHQADLARHGLTPDRFDGGAWHAAHHDGALYAVPLDTHPFVLYYRTDVARKAGLLDAGGTMAPLDGPDGLLNALRAARKATGDVGGALSVTADTATPWRIFQTLYSQLGGQLLSDDGSRVVLDDARAEQALAYLKRLTDEKLVPVVDYGGAVTLFASGRAGFYFQGEWEITTFQTAKIPFDMVRFPHVFTEGDYRTQADSHALVLPRWPGADRAKLDTALGFVRSLLEDSYTWAQGGHVPSWLPVRDSGRYRALSPQSHYADAAAGTVYDPQAWYSGSGSNFESVVSSAVGSVLAGRTSPSVAVGAMRRGLRRLADTTSPL
jgi:multiple sugar transport system substrate-binding protein